MPQRAVPVRGSKHEEEQHQPEEDGDEDDVGPQRADEVDQAHDAHEQ